MSSTHIETAIALVLALGATTLINLAHLREHAAVATSSRPVRTGEELG